MAGTTPTYGFPYPTAGDVPAGYSQMQALALSLEAKIVAMDAILNAQITTRFKGAVTPGTNQVIGTSETIMDEKLTFSAVSGRKYLLLHSADHALTGGSATASTYNFRYAAGASLTTGGTLIETFLGPPPNGGHQTFTRHTVFTAPSTGTFTVGLGYLTNGTGSVTFYANSKTLTVVDVT